MPTDGEGSPARIHDAVGEGMGRMTVLDALHEMRPGHRRKPPGAANPVFVTEVGDFGSCGKASALLPNVLEKANP